MHALSTLFAIALAASAPSGPDALPGLVAGVLGSGDQLSLQMRPVDGAPPRLVHPGETALDGWVLSGLTNATATLTKDGQSRTVGLNPTGALAQSAPTGPPSRVRVNPPPLTPDMQAIMDLSDEAVLAQMRPAIRQSYDNAQPRNGLAAEEVRRLMLYQARFQLLTPLLVDAAQIRARASIALNGGQATAILATESLSAVLFGQDYADLVMSQRQFAYQNQLAAYQAALAAGIGLVRAPTSQAATALNGAYPGAFALIGRDGEAYIYQLTAPAPPTPVDQINQGPAMPLLTAQAAAGLRDIDGAPVDAAAQAAAVAGNQAMRAMIDQQNQRAEEIAAFGPFGPLPQPNIRPLSPR